MGTVHTLDGMLFKLVTTATAKPIQQRIALGGGTTLRGRTECTVGTVSRHTLPRAEPQKGFTLEWRSTKSLQWSGSRKKGNSFRRAEDEQRAER